MRPEAQHEHPSVETTDLPPSKRVCSPNSGPQKSIFSPNCVIALANEYPEDLELGPPDQQSPSAGRPSARHARKDEETVPHMCWWQQLRSLNGAELMRRLKEVQVDEMIDYHGGVLNAAFVDLIVELYDHVAAQGDDVARGVYAQASGFDPETELPYWCPKQDAEGFGRMERLRMAAEYDVWQWYLVTGENYSLLDTLVWMGVHVRKLFSRPPSREEEAE